MAAIAAILDRSGRPATDLVVKFLEHFVLIAEALAVAGALGRGGRLLLRPAPAARRREQCRSRSARWSASCRCSASPRSTRRVVERARRVEQARCRPARAPRRDRAPQEEGALERRRPRRLLARRRRRSSGSCRVLSAAVRRGARSSRRTGCARVSRYHAEHPFVARRSTACTRRSTTSPPSRPPACSAATPTGAGRSGCRSTTWSSTRSHRYARFFGDDVKIEYPTGSGEQLDARARSPTTCASG